MIITRFAAVDRPRGESEETDIATLAREWTTPDDGPAIRLWAAAAFAGGQRGLLHLQSVEALVLDFDGENEDIGSICAALSGTELAWHTTRSHTPEAPRYRVVVALSRPVSAVEHAQILRRWGRGHDPHARDPSHHWYEPVATEHYASGYEPGEPIDVDAALRQHDGLVRACDRVRSATPGSRHATLIREAYLVGGYVGAGAVSEHEALESLVSAARAMGTPDKEARRVVGDGLRAGQRSPVTPSGGTAASGATGGLRILGAAEIFRPLPPIAWICEGLELCPGPPILLAGAGFSGKTYFAQTIATELASGRWLLGGALPARRCRVLHLDYEQGERLSCGRYQAIARGLGIWGDDLDGWLGMACLPDLRIDSADAFAWISAATAGYGVCIVDSLRASCPATDENSSEFRRNLDLLTKVSELNGCAFIVIHHSRKLGKDGGSGASELRGSGAIFDACASVMVFTGDRKGPKTVTHHKARTSGNLSPDFQFEVANVNGGAVARMLPEYLADGTDGTGDDVGECDEVLEQVRVLVEGNPGQTTNWICREIGAKRQRVLDALTTLAERKLIESADGPRGAKLWSPVIAEFPSGLD